MDSVLKVGESGKEDPVFSVADHFCKTKAGAAIRSVPKGMCGCLERVMHMFMGEYNHTIDAKGRLIIPSKFREVLGDEFVVTKGMDGCLFVFDQPEWQAFEEKLRGLPMIDKEARQFTRFFLAGAASVEVDKQGRILLPAVLREFAGITKDTVLVGVGSRVEIWSKDRWEGTVTYQDMEEISKHMIELGIGI